MGESLEFRSINEEEYKSFGKQIGEFLLKLHSAEYSNEERFSVRDEIEAWQERFQKSKDVLARYFNESCYLDEAADFMDFEDDRLCTEVLDAYGADELLREKVMIRRVVRPMFVIGTYRDRSEEEILRFVDRIRRWLVD